MNAHEAVTAQSMYADMLKTEIGPRLRAVGFKGSGGVYVLPDPNRWMFVGLQKSRYSAAELVSFTVNLTAAGKRAWAEARASEPWLPERPGGNAAYPWADTLRLGPLIPPVGRDTWWDVGAKASGSTAAAQVLAAIEQFGIPWLRSQLVDSQRDLARD